MSVRTKVKPTILNIDLYKLRNLCMDVNQGLVFKKLEAGKGGTYRPRMGHIKQAAQAISSGGQLAGQREPVCPSSWHTGLVCREHAECIRRSDLVRLYIK